MRVLVATTGNDGHFGPLVPFAQACVAAGHEVRVAAPASYARGVAGAGLSHEPFDDAPPELIGPVMGRLPSLSFEEADTTVIREVFARIDAQAAAPGIRAAIEAWRPDVLLREPAELGSLAEAERAGVPHAQVAIGMQELTRSLLALTPEPLAELSRLTGLPDRHLTEAWAEEPTFSPVPASLDRAGDEAHREDATVRVGAAPPTAPGVAALPAWGDPDLPLVYVTLGSVTGALPPFRGLYREALEGLADLPVRVLMTVGRAFDLAELGTVPDNAHALSWWPQEHAFAQATAVLGHGGFGTTMGAAGAGLAQVVAPIFTSDQAINGRHVDAFGAGRTVEPGPELMPRAIAALRELLADRSYAARAATLRDELAALPPVSSAVEVLEGLAARR